MKTKILAGLFLILAVSSMAVSSEDNPSQAAARAALAKKLFEMDRPQNQTPSNRNWAVAAPEESTGVKNSAATNTAISPAIPATTNLTATPAKAVAHPVLVAAQPVMPLAKVPVPAPPVVHKANVVPPEIKKPAPPAKAQVANDLVTITGATYRAAQVEKVESDGLVISYVPLGGGLAMVKVYFEDLPDSLRQQYVKPKEKP